MQDGKIFCKTDFIGFTEDDRVYVITRAGSRDIGSFDHRSEITLLVLDWFNTCPER
jgi:hypothetical protein